MNVQKIFNLNCRERCLFQDMNNYHSCVRNLLLWNGAWEKFRLAQDWNPVSTSAELVQMKVSVTILWQLFVETAWPIALGCWIWNLEVPGSNPPPYHYLDNLFYVVPSSTHRLRCGNFSLPQVLFAIFVCLFTVSLNKSHYWM